MSETGQDVSDQYIDTPVGSLGPHKFVKLTEVNPEFAELPKSDIPDNPFNYMLEVYMDDYIVLAIPMSRAQLHHVINAAITGIYDVFPPDKDDGKDAISLKKILKKERAWAIIENVIGFEVDGNPREHTIWLTEYRCADILEKLKKWIREGDHRKKGIPFEEFRTYLAKLRNAFISIPAGKGLLPRATRCW